MAVTQPNDDSSELPRDADFDESFWRGYAIDVAGYRAEWVNQLIEDDGVSALVAELGTESR
jgi:hypothetical protein